MVVKLSKTFFTKLSFVHKVLPTKLQRMPTKPLGMRTRAAG